LTCLIVDDEPLARAYLRSLLADQGAEVVGEAEDAAEALRMADDLRPDVVLLDIQMPGLTGLQMATALMQSDGAPLIIFVTGFSEHAVAAFERDALDYLLKPVSPERLGMALQRARDRRRDMRALADLRHRIAARSAQLPPLRRLPVRADFAVRLLRLEDIVLAMARDKRVFVRTASGEHRTYYTLKQLESILPPDGFARIHDSFLVNLDAVEEVLLLGDHDYEVRLSDGQRLPVGRTRYAELLRRLGISGIASR
jgi:two-component system, LytTR family, response regulator